MCGIIGIITSEKRNLIPEIISSLNNALLYPILEISPLQLFAYHYARVLSNNVDKPRNLAKSVTVE
ncbi:hypothetical protein AUJ77_02320 [Candidatus Nomurabacteria bacterium CG1_02_43_90]|uniref:Glutamine--fructose-6-phosphate transaminase (isomerizing) n=1 Tax=Candidatus Nomurabacteria bacterium CG1_02_43_90 TaxID=1805281 RepID=A0A1J4V762_9BACT|nr:MAG: hypothetical protein AUJ77_02320 [Candidatus Nomurabacteria bacterium CG1_02_43_90]